MKNLDMWFMLEAAISSSLIKIIWAIIASMACFILLRIRDKLVGVNFRTEVIGKILTDAKAVAIYYGLTAFGIFLMFGLLLS